MTIRDIINYAGFFIGLLGIVLSIYLFKKGIEAKDPRFHFRTYTNISKLSDDEDSKIKITYGLEEVSRVFTTYVWVWNNGKKPIYKSDIPPQSNIKITLHDERYNPKILDFKVAKVSRSEINFIATNGGENTLVINFDFLDQNDGAVLEIQHTGSSKTELISDGIILGAPEGLKVIKTNIKNSVFTRLIHGMSVLDINNYTKSPRAFYAFSTTVLLILVVTFASMFYLLNTNRDINITASQLSEAVLAEFPQASEINISNILVNIDNFKSPLIQNIDLYRNYFFGAFVVVYLWTLIYLLVSIARREIVTPYPKSLKLGDDLLKSSKKKNKVG